MKEIKLHIPGMDDRRMLAAILADNGYKLRIVSEVGIHSWEKKYFVVVELNTSEKSK